MDSGSVRVQVKLRLKFPGGARRNVESSPYRKEMNLSRLVRLCQEDAHAWDKVQMFAVTFPASFALARCGENSWGFCLDLYLIFSGALADESFLQHT